MLVALISRPYQVHTRRSLQRFTSVNNFMIVEHRKTPQCIFQYSLRERNQQIFLGQTKEVAGTVFEDQERLLWYRVV